MEHSGVLGECRVSRISSAHMMFSFNCGRLVLTSVQLALARQDAKERELSDDGGAGRMTVTARADIGAPV
jgi:hypothetical protein